MASETYLRGYGALFSKFSLAKFIGLAAISGSILVTACGQDAGTDELLSNFTLDVPVAYIKRPVASLHNPREPIGALPGGNPTDGFAPGGDLYLRDFASSTATEVNLTAAFTAATEDKGAGDVSDLDVSYDGTKIVFAMHEGRLENQDTVPQNTWNIWVYDRTNGSVTRALKSPDYNNEAALGNDIDPIFLADGRIVFASDRKPTSYQFLLEESGEAPPTLLTTEANRNNSNYNLHIMTIGDNPNNIKQLTFNRSHDFNPTLLKDGRIAYLRWENATGRNHFSMSTVRPDGTEYDLLFGAQSYVPTQTETERVLYESRQMPDGRLLSVKMPGSGTFMGGKLVFVDQENFVELNTQRATGISSSSSAEATASKTSVSDGAGLSRGGRFATPFPLWDGSNRALVSWAWCKVNVPDPADNTGNTILRIDPCTDTNSDLPAADPEYGLWMVDLSDLTTTPIILGGETVGMAITDPVALIDRFAANNAPVSLPDKVSGVPGGLDSLMEEGNVGLLKIRSVYDTDTPALIESTTTVNLNTIMTSTADNRLIRFVRITKPSAITDLNGVNAVNRRQIFGYQEVEPDGSVMVQVPALQPFGIELLDKYGRRLRGDTSWLQVLPGETIQCNGCHASRSTSTPLNAGSPNGEAFPGTVLDTNVNVALFPQYGETMAETRARKGGCDTKTNMNCSYVRLKGDLVYTDDIWKDPENEDTANDVLDINVAYADLVDTPSPVDSGCTNRGTWSAGAKQYCWISIDYEQHIQPLWEKERPQVDDMGAPIYNTLGDSNSGQLNYKCTRCHTEVDPDDDVTEMVPAGQLTLTRTGLHASNTQYTSYLELRNNDEVQILNNGALEYKLVMVNVVTDNTVDPPVRADVPMRVPLVDGNDSIPAEPIPDSVNTDGIPASDRPVRANANSRNDGPFFTKMTSGFVGGAFGNTVDHSGMMTDIEMRLMIEWIDTGAQYRSDATTP